jgi:hypothetical protein
MRNLILTGFFSVLVCFQITLAQTTTTIVQLSESNNANAMAQTGNIRPTADGTGYLIVGTSGYEDYARAMVIRTDLNYTPIWTRKLDFPISTIFGNAFRATYGIDITDLGNGNYVLLANINRNVLSNSNVLQNLDYGLVRFKVTNTGTTTVQWTKTYGGDFNDVAHSLIKTSDGNLLISGYSNPEYGLLNIPGKARAFLVKTTTSGQNLWNNRYWDGECNTTLIGAIQGMNYRPVVETSDGNYVFATICDEWIYITKINSSGVAVWTKQMQAGGAIGDAFQAGNIGGLGGAILSGGTISSIQELPNGELAFMGNYVVSAVAFVWSNSDQKVFLNGVGIPMGFLFKTSAMGAFKDGQIFFHERLGDGTQPTEMLCHDFSVLPNGQMLVVAGVGQYGNYYNPALLKINTSATAIDQAVLEAAVLTNTQVRYDNNDNPRGQSQMQLLPKANDEGATIAFNLKNIVRISNVSQLPVQNTCMCKLNNVRSLPIQLVLTDRTPLTKASLVTGNITVKLSNKTVTATTLCEGTGLSSYNEDGNDSQTIDNEHTITERTATSWSSDMSIFPNPNNGSFTISLGGDTPEKDISVQLWNTVGQIIHSDQINIKEANGLYSIQFNHLANGVYFLQLSSGTNTKVLRMVVQNGE